MDYIDDFLRSGAQGARAVSRRVQRGCTTGRPRGARLRDRELDLEGRHFQGDRLDEALDTHWVA
ncbi:hypothetical protein [Sorangium sp. So ce1182]|uniref:hypothetical protein n=1 Tax=Sorangium sp. So ce1182 TaxID=3133334 RepID=UPI003F5E8214